MHVSVQECVAIQKATLWIFYGQPAHNKRAGFLFEFSSNTGLLRILRTECIQRASESFFSF